MPKIIAHFMHEYERDTAKNLITKFEETDSYLVAKVDEDKILELEKAGLIVEIIEEQPPEETPGGDWEVLPGVRRVSGVQPSLRGGLEELNIDLSKPNIYLIQLQGPLLESWRDQLKALGVELLEFIPRNSYTAWLTSKQSKDVGQLAFVNNIRLYTAQDTGQPVVAERSLEPPARGYRIITYDVLLHRSEDASVIFQWLKEKNVNIAGVGGRKIRLYLLEDDPLANEIGTLPEVASIEEYMAPKLYNDVAREILGIDDSGSSNPHTKIPQMGKDQIVGVADTGIDENHPDFKGRIVGVVPLGRVNDASDPHGHGTHVAGSILGDGAVSNKRLCGIAPEAKLFFQSLLDAQGDLGGLPLNLEDLFEEAYQAGARIHNNSWGADRNSAYTYDSMEVDEFVSKRRDMLVVIASGNAGQEANRLNSQKGFVDWLSIGSPASSKNALTVGASRSKRTNGGYSELTYGEAWSEFPDPPITNEKVSGNPEGMAAFSSRGPCDDRRIKPDVVAPGTDIASTKSSSAPLRNFWGAYPGNSQYAFMGGTSMATPLVSGCAALVREFYVKGRNHEPSAALLKATLINSTHTLTGADALADHNSLPNYHQGFGGVYMPWAVPMDPKLKLEFFDTWKNPALQFNKSGERFRFRFSSDVGLSLRLCLVWTDPPGRALQNDIDLILQLPSGGQKVVGNFDRPQRLTAMDRDNNVEIIRLDNPIKGDYLIQITAYNLLRVPQDFALVVTGPLTSSLMQI